MKIRTISRIEEDYTRKSKDDIFRIQKNLEPSIHPFEKAREYQRALNATKLTKMFSKPFVAALSGHKDGIFCMAKHPINLEIFLSGSCDGEVKLWNLGTLRNVFTAQAHKAYVRGICVSPNGDYFLSCSEDKTIKMWSLNDLKLKQYKKDCESEEMSTKDSNLMNIWTSTNSFICIDHQRKKSSFATGGSTLLMWDENRSEPISTYEWDYAIETVINVKFNPIETDVFASTGSDRSIVLYDMRMAVPLRKLILEMRSNSICWNPMEAFNFTVANEDSNCYSFDMRKLDIATNVHKDHVSAVMSLDYSPTGREFVTGSYDKTIRVFDYNKGHSKEIYHTKRMQKIFSVLWTLDSKFLLSGSDESNIRLWKAKADQKIGTINTREQNALNYSEKLKERYQHHPEIKRISRHRHVPKAIKNEKELRRIMISAQQRKEKNRRAHSNSKDVPFQIERKKSIVSIKK